MQSESYDLAVIGAGIVGAMAAYLACQTRNDWRIALIDRSFVGCGATQYSVGLDIPYGNTPLKKQLSAQSAQIYRDVKAALPALPIYPLPFFGIVNKANVEEVIAGFADDGVRIANDVETGQLRHSYPDLTLADDQVILTGHPCRYGFPRRIVEHLTHRFKEHAYSVCLEGVEIQTVRQKGEAFSLCTSDGQILSAQRVLVATGPWLLEGPGSAVAQHAGLRIKKVAALHVDRCPQPGAPALYFFDDDAFLLPVYEHRHWLLSFNAQEWDCPLEISRLRITAEDRALALTVLNRYCPSFVGDCHSGRVFCDAYSRDGTPLISALQDTPDFVIAGAGSGSGYRLAPGIAQEALQRLSGFPV